MELDDTVDDSSLDRQKASRIPGQVNHQGDVHDRDADGEIEEENIDQNTAKKARIEKGDTIDDSNRTGMVNGVEVSYPSPTEAQTSKLPNSCFDTDLLRIYYSSIFPVEKMYKWLSYGGDLIGEKDFFFRREFSFTLENDIYIRYLSFRSAEELKTEILRKLPHKIDIGAVYSVPAKNHNAVQASAFKPLYRELVFDIDLTDYDDVRVGCTTDMMWERGSWQYMALAIKIVDLALRDDFGFENILWVFSGRRGIHCWVCDLEALKLEDRERSAIVEYLSLIVSNDGSKLTSSLTTPLVPMIKRAMPMMEKVFNEMVCSPQGQDFLADQDRWEKVLKYIPDEDIREDMRCEWAGSEQSSQHRWKQLKATVLNRAERKGKLSAALKKSLQAIVIAYTYPRLDVNVSIHRNHLLKSPFVVHPKTGKVCVPIFDVENCDRFDPDNVPSLKTLIGNFENVDPESSGEKLSDAQMSPFFDGFERQFLKPLLSKLKRANSERNEMTAPATGDW